MSSPSGNRVVTARAAAILTTGAVSASTFILNRAWGSKLCVDIRFTLGSLTNCTFAYYVSMDESTWVPVADSGGNLTYVPDANATKTVLIEAPGWSYFKTTAQGSGTTTSSSATIYYRWITRAI